MYSYSIDNEEAANYDNEGRVFTIPNGPVSFNFKAFMPKSEANYDLTQVRFEYFLMRNTVMGTLKYSNIIKEIFEIISYMNYFFNFEN